MNENIWLWVGFNIFIILMLLLDLGLMGKKSKEVTLKKSLVWTGVWIALAMVFNLGIWYYRGSASALEFFTGYVIEKSLSMDNVFVFVLLFSYFSVPAKYQHKVLFWGIFGAMIMRAVMITVGIVLITKFAWIMYILGGFLIFTGIKMLFKKEEQLHPEKNPIVRLFKKLMPVSNEYHGNLFFVVEKGIRKATPLFIVLLLIEFTDLIFAMDSIPAIFAVTKNPFIVYTSNIFAILGLRSLYFALAGMMDRFCYLNFGLGIILAFVGVKMLLAHSAYKIDTLVSLVIIAAILATSIGVSFLKKPEEKK